MAQTILSKEESVKIEKQYREIARGAYKEMAKKGELDFLCHPIAEVTMALPRMAELSLWEDGICKGQAFFGGKNTCKVCNE